MKILLIDNDIDYMSRFKYYFNKKYSDVQITICEDIEKAKPILEEVKFDIVLLDSGFYEVKGNSLYKDSVLAYISSTNEMIDGENTIFKYKGISIIYSEICTLYEKKKNRIVQKNDFNNIPTKEASIITFLPVNGGAGSSTMAAACTISLSEEYKVLYINLEQRPSDAIFFKGEKRESISDIVAFFKTKYTEIATYELLKNVIQVDKKQLKENLYYIKGFTNILESSLLTEQMIEALFDIIRKRFDFKYIIIDADFIVNSILKKLIISSDSLVFVSSGSDVSNIKLAKVHRYLELIERESEEHMPEKYLLLNQYYGMNDEKSIAHDMEIIGRLARYRTDDKSRITTQQVIEQVNNKDTFAKFKNIPVNLQENIDNI